MTKINTNIEFLRLLAAFFIVIFHAGNVPLRLESYSGLVIFTILFVYFTPHNNKQSTALHIKNRASRLITPWLFWCLLYGIFNISFRGNFSDSSGHIFLTLLTGTSIHLWFLPFAFFISSLIILFESCLFSQKYFSILFLFCSSISLPIMSFWGNISGELPTPLHQWRHALPAVCIGLFFRYRTEKRPLLVPVTMIVLSSAFAAFIGGNAYGAPYIIGTLLCAGALFLKPFFPQHIAHYSRTAYGIYLLHPMLYTVLYKNGVPPSLPVACLVFVISFSIIALVKNISYSQQSPSDQPANRLPMQRPTPKAPKP